MPAVCIYTVKTASRNRACGKHVEAVEGIAFARMQARFFANDAVTFHNKRTVVTALNNPTARKKCHRLQRVILDGHKVDENMRAPFRGIVWIVAIHEFIQSRGQSFNFSTRFGHNDWKSVESTLLLRGSRIYTYTISRFAPCQRAESFPDEKAPRQSN